MKTRPFPNALIGIVSLSSVFLSMSTALALEEAADSPEKEITTRQVDDCYAVRQRQNDTRKTNVAVEALSADISVEISEFISLIQFTFPELVLDALSYSCLSTKRITHPAHTGFAWLVTIPTGTRVSVHVAEAVNDDFGSTTSLIANFPTIRAQLDGPRLVVSGPFWRTARFREEPIGLIVHQGRRIQRFESDFSATQVLCADASDHSLSLLATRVQGNINQRAIDECTTAIQVGPAFFEASTESGRVGIGGTSTYESRRNLLAQFDTQDDSATQTRPTILLSTITDVSAFDTMVLVDVIADHLFDGAAVRWAVGLVDDESLLGPIVLVPGHPPLRLTQSTRPAGAVLVFDWPE